MAKRLAGLCLLLSALSGGADVAPPAAACATDADGFDIEPAAVAKSSGPRVVVQVCAANRRHRRRGAPTAAGIKPSFLAAEGNNHL